MFIITQNKIYDIDTLIKGKIDNNMRLFFIWGNRGFLNLNALPYLMICIE